MLPRVLLLLASAALLLAEHNRVDPRNTYERVLCVVPLVGSGTPADPMRPQYAPWPPAPTDSRTAIIAFSHQISDDGRFALVEFIARDRQAFDAILKDKSIRVFEKGRHKKDEIEKELKKFRKDFDLDKFGMVHP